MDFLFLHNGQKGKINAKFEILFSKFCHTSKTLHKLALFNLLGPQWAEWWDNGKMIILTQYHILSMIFGKEINFIFQE
jgi:hypothetical protein